MYDASVLREALDLVVADLHRTVSHPPPGLRFVATTKPHHAYLARDDPDRLFSDSGGVNAAADRPVVEVRVAHEVCDALASGRFGEPESWPVCPIHRTVVRARIEDDVVMWVCRGRGNLHYLGRLGALPAP